MFFSSADYLFASGKSGCRVRFRMRSRRAITAVLRSDPEVLVLYRKREGARRIHEHGVFARFRYNDLKEDAGVCGGCGGVRI